jgi:hypothetical protein
VVFIARRQLVWRSAAQLANAIDIAAARVLCPVLGSTLITLVSWAGVNV